VAPGHQPPDRARRCVRPGRRGPPGVWDTGPGPVRRRAGPERPHAGSAGGRRPGRPVGAPVAGEDLRPAGHHPSSGGGRPADVRRGHAGAPVLAVRHTAGEPGPRSGPRRNPGGRLRRRPRRAPPDPGRAGIGRRPAAGEVGRGTAPGELGDAAAPGRLRRRPVLRPERRESRDLRAARPVDRRMAFGAHRSSGGQHGAGASVPGRLRPGVRGRDRVLAGDGRPALRLGAASRARGGRDRGGPPVPVAPCRTVRPAVGTAVPPDAPPPTTPLSPTHLRLLDAEVARVAAFLGVADTTLALEG